MMKENRLKIKMITALQLKSKTKKESLAITLKQFSKCTVGVTVSVSERDIGNPCSNSD